MYYLKLFSITTQRNNVCNCWKVTINFDNDNRYYLTEQCLIDNFNNYNTQM